MGKTFKSPKLSAMKYEVASQLGMSNYQTVDKGNLTSRQNGYVGGNITKSLVAQALGETGKLETPNTTSGTITGFSSLSE